jgi:hypothetical protein
LLKYTEAIDFALKFPPRKERLFGRSFGPPWNSVAIGNRRKVMGFQWTISGICIATLENFENR